jgi:hypothetical protein
MTTNETSIIDKLSVELAIDGVPNQGTARGAARSQDAAIMSRIENAIELALVACMYLEERWNVCSSTAAATMSACVPVRNAIPVPANAISTCHPGNAGFFDR